MRSPKSTIEHYQPVPGMTFSVDTSDLVSNAHGNRVANKLGRRGYVTVEIRKNNLLSALHRQTDTPISAIVGSAEDAQLFISSEDTAHCGKHL